MNIFRGFHALALLPCAILMATPALADGPFDAASHVDDAQLAYVTGRQDLNLVNETKQAASVSNNSVVGNSTTGIVNISDNAFQNLSGLSVVNANTGNNVAINASMQVNVFINPTP